MRRYLLRRLAQAIPVFLVITVIYFGLMHAVPGGPLGMYAESPRMSPADIERLERNLGLHEPLPVQYARWLSAALRFDLGHSYSSLRPVTELILERLAATIELNVGALLVGLLVGVPLGVYSALKRGSAFDNGVRVLVVVLSAAPGWWVGVLSITFFANVYMATGVRIFPLGGIATLGTGSFDVLDRLWHLALPALIAGTGGWVAYTRFLRSEVLETLGQDYVRTAQAKGLAQRLVLFRHVLRNALIPVVTMFSGLLAGLIAGAPIYEQIFAWPGIGRLALDAALKHDYPVLLGIFYISTILMIISFILADVAYGLVDPRVRYE